MIRFLRQSTAIAATLALVMPQMGLAQFSIGAEDIDDHRAAMEAEQPQLAARLAQELAAGLSTDVLTCAAPTQGQPCPEGTPLVTPGGLAVLLAEDGSILLAPPADQELAAASALDTPAPILDGVDPDSADAEIVEEATDALPDEAQPDEAVGDKPPAAKPDAEAAAEDVQEQVQDPPRPKPATRSDIDEADTAGTPDAVEAETSDASAQDQTATESAASQIESTEESDELTEDDAEDETPARDIVEADAAADDVAADDAPSSEPSATPGKTSRPQADEVESEDDLARMLAAIEDEKQDDTPPEARSITPDEAATRAAEGTTPDAAALAVEDLDMVAGDLETMMIGEEDARSSAVDFVTSMAQAVQGAPRSDDGQEEDAGGSAAANSADTADTTGSNRDRDIARALLAGLAGYAVGQMLPADQGQVALNSGDRVVITRPDGSQEVLKDDNALMFRPGAQVQTQNFDDGSSRVVVTREDGSRVITIRDADLRVLRRTLVRTDGSVVKLIDDTAEVEPIKVSELPPAAKPRQPENLDDEDALRRALEAEAAHSRRFTLGQIRAISGVRALVAPISIDAITFDTGSAAITPDQARQLATLGNVIKDYIRSNPDEIFLVEGYTDTVGAEAMNLALSDRRAESLALALAEYFDVPPENLVVQGYGERFLKVPVEGDVRQNRRVAVRRITDLLARD